MKALFIFLVFLLPSTLLIGQTLQNVVDNGNTTNSAVRFVGRTDFGEEYDPAQYGCIQIVRPVSQGNKFHLSFIRHGNMVYGMGLLNNSNLFGIQPGSNNAGDQGIFMTTDGKVSIGTIDSKGYKLAVAGNVIAESVKVKLNGTWPDFVFNKQYLLPTLKETEAHIKEKGHLPGIPSAADVKANGIDLGEMNAKLLQKIEELTLHLIEMKKENEQFKKKFLEQDQLIEQIKGARN